MNADFHSQLIKHMFYPKYPVISTRVESLAWAKPGWTKRGLTPEWRSYILAKFWIMK